MKKKHIYFSKNKRALKEKLEKEKLILEKSKDFIFIKKDKKENG